MDPRRVKLLLDSQAECPTHPEVKSKPGLRDSFLMLLLKSPSLELWPQDPLTIKDQGGEDQKTQHVACRVDHCPLLTMNQALFIFLLPAALLTFLLPAGRAVGGRQGKSQVPWKYK